MIVCNLTHPTLYLDLSRVEHVRGRVARVLADLRRPLRRDRLTLHLHVDLLERHRAVRRVRIARVGLVLEHKVGNRLDLREKTFGYPMTVNNQAKNKAMRCWISHYS